MMRTSTWEAKIYCGLQAGYSGRLLSIERIKKVCQEYCDDIGWCVTVTPTTFIYKEGNESGAVIGIINYPRFALSENTLKERTFTLAELLLTELEQLRISIVLPDETVMLETSVDFKINIRDPLPNKELSHESLSHNQRVDDKEKDVI